MLYFCFALIAVAAMVMVWVFVRDFNRSDYTWIP